MRRFLMRFSFLLAVLLLVMAPAAAHEGREVGPYQIVFGWRVEPAYAGQLNGPEVIISLGHHDESEASDDHPHDADEMAAVEVSLQVEVRFGPEVKTLPLRPVFNAPGHYVADLIPTLPGDYSFHLTGTIGDTAVEELFSSADGEFSSVEPASDLLFPQGAPSNLETRIAQLEAQIAELKAALAELQGS